MWMAQEKQKALTQVSDGQLIQFARAGEEQAFESLVYRYASFLFQRIIARVKDYDTSCDILQHVLIQLYFSLPTLDQKRSLQPWLIQVTRRKIIDEMRRTRRSVLSDHLDATEEEAWLLLADSTPVPEAQLEHLEIQHAIQEAIARLPQRYQRVVMLRYLTPFSFAEIGDLLGIPEATAKTHFQRARPLLQATLSQQERREEVLSVGPPLHAIESRKHRSTLPD